MSIIYAIVPASMLRIEFLRHACIFVPVYHGNAVEKMPRIHHQSGESLRSIPYPMPNTTYPAITGSDL